MPKTSAMPVSCAIARASASPTVRRAVRPAARSSPCPAHSPSGTSRGRRAVPPPPVLASAATRLSRARLPAGVSAASGPWKQAIRIFMRARASDHTDCRKADAKKQSPRLRLRRSRTGQVPPPVGQFLVASMRSQASASDTMPSRLSSCGTQPNSFRAKSEFATTATASPGRRPVILTSISPP